jgi:poly-gamma-glutamate synthesis protein (capsule biosynthesis protein)
VGDLLLASDPAGKQPARDPATLFAGVRQTLAGCDVVFGNLECTLPGVGRTIPTEPRVIATPQLVRSIGDAGFNVVTLANNHMFDCLDDGFHNLRSLLDEMHVACFGAGDNIEEAAAPAILDVKGMRIAFLGAVDRSSGPHQFADAGRWGVAPLDVDRLAAQVRDLRETVNHVVVSLHWGQERFRLPSPSQVAQARALAEAGASMIIGHHPHVIQGLEIHRGVPIVYSLGNFVACDVPYSDGDLLRWNRLERTGCILRAEITSKSVENPVQLPTCDDGRGVELDHSGCGARAIARANRAVARGVSTGRYRRESFRVQVLIPVLQHLKWSRLRKMNLKKIRRGISRVLRPGRTS